MHELDSKASLERCQPFADDRQRGTELSGRRGERLGRCDDGEELQVID
jgi:hypothetical protein